MAEFDRMEAIRKALGPWSEPGLRADAERMLAETLRIREKFLAKRDAVRDLGERIGSMSIVWALFGAVTANRYRREVRLTGDVDAWGVLEHWRRLRDGTRGRGGRTPKRADSDRARTWRESSGGSAARRPSRRRARRRRRPSADAGLRRCRDRRLRANLEISDSAGGGFGYCGAPRR
jgi:hypothetical protein